MTRAGDKLIAGAREALAVVRGEQMPAKVTAFGWATWHPKDGLGSFIYGDEKMAKGCAGRDQTVVRVKVETI